jgi:hypothetical protein
MKADRNTYNRILKRWGYVRNRLYGDYMPIASFALGLPPEDYAVTRELLETVVDRRSYRLLDPLLTNVGEEV